MIKRRIVICCQTVLAVLLGSIVGCVKAPPAAPSGGAAKSSQRIAPLDMMQMGAQTAEANLSPPKAGPNEPAKPVTPPASGSEKPAAGSARAPITSLFVLPAADGSDDKLSSEAIRTMLDDPKNHETIIPQAPLGLGDVASLIPADNPMTRAKVELGRMLYFDKRLSRDSTVACATCHDPSTGWAQNRQFAAGIKGQEGGRNAPTVINRIFGTKVQFWDGRAASLEEQSLGPIQNPIEMGFTLDELIERLKGIDGYQQCFDKIFGGISAENIAKAIASFERTVLVGDSPYDYFNQAEPFRKLGKDDLDADPELAEKAKQAFAAAEAHPFSESARRGRELFFGKANCTACHAGVNFADELFYNIGVGVTQTEPDPGRVTVSKDEKDTGSFKTPTVRNVAMNAPYMHDGTQKTLLEVVKHYDQGGGQNPHLSQRMKKLNLTEQEQQDLVAFMSDGLTGAMPDIRAPKLP